MEKLERRQPTIQSEVAGVLRDRILRGRLNAGDHLRQNHIAEEFAVSNIPVRDALRQLAAEGLVRIEPYRGAIVAAISIEEFEEIAWLRALLEPELLRQGMPKMGPPDIAEMQSVLKAIDEMRTVRTWGRLNWKFHSLLYKPADLPQAFAIVERLQSTVERFLQIEASVLDNVKTSQAEHYAILTQIECGNADKAAALLKEHIEVDAHKAIAAIKRGDGSAVNPSLTGVRAV